MRTGKLMTIECQCGRELFRYFKAGKGRLIKLIISRIQEDKVGLMHCPTLYKPLCPNCGKELGIIQMVHGEPALKLNQGTIKGIRV